MTPASAALRRATLALLFGNFAIGSGVMVVAGSLNDLVQALHISVALGGQLISIGALSMGLGAPLLAALVSGFDRRRLLTLALLWFAAGHVICAVMPDYLWLAPLRALAVLGAAVFTPQAAAAIGHMSTPATRGHAITTVFLGWSLSSVIGLPLHAYIGETLGWRWAFSLVALLSAAAAGWVWRAVPDGVRPAALSLTQWRTVLTSPVLLAIVAVTALASAGQFTLFSYMAPYYRQVLSATPLQVSLLFLWFGLFGVIGNVALTRVVDRFGPTRAVSLSLGLMLIGLLLWPWAHTITLVAIVIVPWALGCFSSNSGQQARLVSIAPVLAPALMALNSSAIYLGQAIGAASGGLLLSSSGYDGLAWVGGVWLGIALSLSAWATRAISQGRLPPALTKTP